MSDTVKEKTSSDSPFQEHRGSELSSKGSHTPEVEHSEGIANSAEKMHKIDDTEAFDSNYSDGKINWTPQQVCATISLAMIYVGMCS